MRRGDIVTVAAPGSYTGKPRPALVVQSDTFNETHASITLCLLTTHLRRAPLFRIAVSPEPSTGLTRASQVMVDKLVTVPRDRIGERLGVLDSATLERVDESLRTWLGL